MNFENLTLEELKDIAKEKGIKIGNISKEKLIEKIQENENVSAVINVDDDLAPEPIKETFTELSKEAPKSILETINDTLDDLDDTDADDTYEADFTPLSDNAKVQVRSITFGRLVYRSPTNNALFIWDNIGATKTLTIAEIIELNNARPDFLQEPRLILLDETAIKQFRLTHIYENVAEINNLKVLFKKSEAEISKVIDKALMVNMRDILISKIRTMYANKSLTDINVIHLLESKLKFDLTMG